MDTPTSAEAEIAKERTFGGAGVEVHRTIHVIDLADSDTRRAEIDAEVWAAAADVGFFQVVNHGISQSLVDAAFAMTQAFFALDEDKKHAWARPPGSNSGFESRSQKRPSTGTLDQKESYQITVSRMDELGLWPNDADLAGFRTLMEDFEHANWLLAMRLLGCFARTLGFDDRFFADRHNPASSSYQSTLRLLHYFAVSESDPTLWRAGAHTDYDCLTLLHQQPGQRGLQVCPGADAGAGERGDPLGWTSVEPVAGTVTCNIGDMLMRWSDDRLQSTLHRVQTPGPDADRGPRYSMAFFAQADRDAIIQGPGRKYGPITAADYLQQRIDANFVA